MACPQLGVILAYWKQTGVSSPKNPIALAVGVSRNESIMKYMQNIKDQILIFKSKNLVFIII